jgi:DMSO/TMAO reductase YedYZ molybdopterin-dependent catalytic subunit
LTISDRFGVERQAYIGPSRVASMSEIVDVTDLYREFGEERLPPGQRETSDFPVLSKSGTPPVEEPTVEVWGAVEEQTTFSLDEFRALPSETQRQDFHCVTGWSKFDCEFTGVTFPTLAEAVGACEDAVHVMFHAADGYTGRSAASRCPPTTAVRSGSSRPIATPTRAPSG